MADFKYIDDFGGLMTDEQADKIPDRYASDIRNIDLSIKGMIQSRKGYRVFANEITDTGINLRGFVYKKNYGTLKTIFFRVRDNGTNSILEWLNPSNTATSDGKFEPFLITLTSGKIMGFAPFNNTNNNAIAFCNGVDDYRVWNGATGTFVSATSNTIVINETIASEGFTTPAGSVVIRGIEYAYTGTSGSTFTGVTPDPTTGSHVAAEGVAQKPTIYASNPKGNIFLVAQSRVWMAGVPGKESTMYYTKTGDPDDFTAGANPADGGIEDFPDSGGPITLLDTKDNSRVIVHKEDAILLFSLEYTDTAKIAKLDTLAQADDIGSTNLKAGCGLNQASYYSCGVDPLKSIARAIDGQDLNMDSESEFILPTVEGYDNRYAATVFYPKKRAIFAATRSSTSETANNKIVSYYIKKTREGSKIVDISIDEGYIADWAVMDKKLYGLSSIDQNVYVWLDNDYSANGVGVNHSYTTKEFTFKEPAKLKDFDIIYIEGLIRDFTKIKISVISGILGSDGTREQILSWQDKINEEAGTGYVSPNKISAIGTEALGTVSLGASNEDIRDSYIFSVPIHFDVEKTDRFKIKVETLYDDDNVDTVDSYWAVTNIGFNPRLSSLKYNEIINTNV